MSLFFYPTTVLFILSLISIPSVHALSLENTKFFSSPENSLSERITNILTKENVIGNFNSEGKATLHLELHDISFPIQISADADNFHVTIEPGHCLELDLKKDGSSATLAWLESNPKCPIKITSGMGNFLLEVVDKLALILGVPKIHLTDGSSIKCDGREVELPLLKLLKDGKTWYESKGYRPSSGTDQEAYNLYRHQVNHLRGLTVFEIFKRAGVTKDPVAQLLTNYQEENKSEKKFNIPAADFFSWLWKYDCKKYINLIDHIANREETIGIIQKVTSMTKMIESFNTDGLALKSCSEI